MSEHSSEVTPHDTFCPSRVASTPSSRRGHGDDVASTRRYQSKRQHPRTRDAQVIAIFNLLKGFPDLVKDFYQFLPAEDRAGAREVVAAEVARLDAIGKPTVAAPPFTSPKRAWELWLPSE